MVHPQYGHALISALCGSPIRAAAETVWSVPVIRDPGEADRLRLDWDNEWGVRFREECAHARQILAEAARATGRHLATPPQCA